MSVSAVNIMTNRLDMVHVLRKDVAVIIHVLDTANRYVEEIGLSPSFQSVSRLPIYQ